MYVMVCIKPYIAQAMVVLSKFMSNIGIEHWTCVKTMIRCMWGTYNYYLVPCDTNVVVKSLKIQGFVDVD